MSVILSITDLGNAEKKGIEGTERLGSLRKQRLQGISVICKYGPYVRYLVSLRKFGEECCKHDGEYPKIVGKIGIFTLGSGI